MKKEIIIGIVIALAIIIATTAYFVFFSGVKGIDYSCSADSDCILVQTSCCSCLLNGEDVEAINKNSEGKWNKHLACAITICAQCPEPVSPFSAKCVKNKCHVI